MHPNLLALGSRQISFMANRTNSYMELEQTEYLGSFDVNQNQNVPGFVSVVRYLGAEAEAKGTCFAQGAGVVRGAPVKPRCPASQGHQPSFRI